MRLFSVAPLRPLVALVVVVVASGSVPLAAAGDAKPKPPNILLILADDLGFSDIGCYGGEAQTPNLDRLAKDGLRFTQFYNTARCWPSRAAILTGYYAQQVRRDAIPGLGGGGEGTRPAWAPLLPNFLKPLGYRSYVSGKWHVDGLTLENGFDRSYILDDHNRFFAPVFHSEDDQKLPPVDPKAGYYATTAIADHAIKTLKQHAAEHAEKPFFEYLAFTCPHFPLHALPQDIDRYRDRYKQGWDVLRAERLQRMREMGIVNCELSERTSGVPAWNTTTAEQRAYWEIRMAIHAAMVDRMDQEIGRVIEQLRAMNALDNTLVLFMSDNGASAEKLVRGDGHDPNAPPGSGATFMCIEPAGANLANAPLKRSKMFVHEGGIATPLIVHWPNGFAARGELRHTAGHLIDLVPTLLEVAGTAKPATWQDKPIPPAPGKSLVPALATDAKIARDDLWWFHVGNRAIRVDDWKLVSAGDEGPWELYDLAADRSETKDLASERPDKVQELSAAWKKRLEEFRELAARDLPPDQQGKAKGRNKKKAAG